MEDERRRGPRAELLATVTWRDGDREIRFEAENVSVTGLCFTSAVPLRKGALMSLGLALPPGYVPLGPATLVLAARVVRVEPHGERRYSVAVEFEDLGEAEEGALEKYVRRRSLIARSA